MLQYSDAWLDEKPYKEVYDGFVHLKVSGMWAHGSVQVEIAVLLRAWAQGRGTVGTEWRFHPLEGVILVPDVAFVFAERYRRLTSERDRNYPPFAPDLVAEVRSPDDREKNIRRKTELYLAGGATAILNVDTERRFVRVTTQNEDAVLEEGDVFTHPAFPGLEIPVGAIFAPLDLLG